MRLLTLALRRMHVLILDCRLYQTMGHPISGGLRITMYNGELDSVLLTHSSSPWL
mgnify:CR=1 FL=1